MHRSFSGIPLRDEDVSEGCEKSPLAVLMVEIIKLSGGPDSFGRRENKKLLTLEQEEHGDFMGMYKAPV